MPLLPVHPISVLNWEDLRFVGCAETLARECLLIGGNHADRSSKEATFGKDERTN